MMQNRIQGYVFEAYGTLFDTAKQTTDMCEQKFPGKGHEIAWKWYQKTMEYSWVGSLMEQQANFQIIVERALRASLSSLNLSAEPNSKCFRDILDSFLELEPFPDVMNTIMALKKMGKVNSIASNGTFSMIQHLIGRVGLTDGFKNPSGDLMITSAERVNFFKPHKLVYQEAQAKIGMDWGDIAYVTASHWDAAGAKAAGFKHVFLLQRPSAHNCVDFFGEFQPTEVIHSLFELFSEAARPDLSVKCIANTQYPATPIEPTKTPISTDSGAAESGWKGSAEQMVWNPNGPSHQIESGSGRWGGAEINPNVKSIPTQAQTQAQQKQKNQTTTD